MKDGDFRRLLKITRLKLSAEEEAAIRKDIEEVIRYLGKVNDISASANPAYQPIRVPTRFRKDTASAFKNIEGLKKGSKLQGGYVLGPKL